MPFNPSKALHGRHDCYPCFIEKKIDFEWSSNSFKYIQRAGARYRQFDCSPSSQPFIVLPPCSEGEGPETLLFVDAMELSSGCKGKMDEGFKGF